MKRQLSVVTALVAGAALLLSACGSDSKTTSSDSSGPAATGSSAAGTESSAAGSDAGSSSAAPAEATGGVILANGTEPQNPLIPSNTNEVGGGRIIDNIFAKLVYYDAKGETHMEAAESIETTDSKTFTVKLKAGQKFTDGEPVTSASFIDAWNFGADVTNAQLSSYFFDPIEGFADVNYCEKDAGPPDKKGKATCLPAPKAKTMSGLKKVDDTTFTITLTEAQSDFPLRLGYSAFAPLPTSAFKDIKAFGENPVGNGPYMLSGPGSWEHNVKIDLVPNPDYTGDRKPQNGGLTFTFYQAYEAAYSDLQSNLLDVIDGIPPGSLTSYETDLPGRSVNQPAAVFQSFTVPARDPHFSGEEGNLRRQAISMAINRDEITKIIFSGTRTPASDFTSPVIAGWSDSLKGADVLKFNADGAKKAWAAANAISPWDGKFTIAYNSDGGHKEWVDAVSNSIKNTLGIDAEGKPYASFAELRTQVTDRSIEGGFRTGWQADYPSVSNFLGPIYKTGAGSNDGDYSNPEFDKLLGEGSAAKTVEEGNKFYEQAQEILLKELPAIPLWYSNVTGGFSTNVSNVQFGWDSQPIYYAIQKKA
ncbi:ABC transporter substrate-binding protein [Nakamurella antarctica]|uniref:ABC transporter substrate-binding protein n=1 Tax=Nakamurella antarctica TaxID=1902245 RepID=A0A3G8ZJR4_9ACTN|nr:ABC transporter substrate-binding protein [Nakamurella antarctica]AZI57450.1 ABC transporter substrate-binding protein [Nakamurella antarctica]